MGRDEDFGYNSEENMIMKILSIKDNIFIKCKLNVNDNICIDLYYFINLIYLIYRIKFFFWLILFGFCCIS